MGFYDLFSLDSLKSTIIFLQTLYLSNYSFKCFANINMAYPVLQVGVNVLMSLRGSDTIGLSKEECSFV